MTQQVSVARLNLLRAMYLTNLVLLGWGIWPQMLGIHRAVEPLPAIAFSFWAVLGALSGFGLRYPLAMLPLPVLQLFYKVLWLVAVWLPLQLSGAAADMSVGGLDLAVICFAGAVGDLVVIPWRYVVARFVRAPGDPWRRTGSRPASASASSSEQLSRIA